MFIQRRIESYLYSAIFAFCIFISFLICVVFSYHVLSKGGRGFFYHYIDRSYSTLVSESFVEESSIFEDEVMYKTKYPVQDHVDQYIKNRKQYIQEMRVSPCLYREQNTVSLPLNEEEVDRYLVLYPFSIFTIEGTSIREVVSHSTIKRQDLSEDSCTIIVMKDIQTILSFSEIAYIEFLLHHKLINAGVRTSFFSSPDSFNVYSAGILGSMLGSISFLFIALVFAGFFGFTGAIASHEFMARFPLSGLFDSIITSLASCPSILFGLCGYLIFIKLAGYERGSAAVCGLVLALMATPIIFISVKDALAFFPNNVRMSVYALGANKVRLINDHIIPYVAPYFIKGCVVALSRIAGETAPLIIIGGRTFLCKIGLDPSLPVVGLPTLIYLWAQRGSISFQEIAFSLVIIMFLLITFTYSIFLLIRKKKNL